MKLEIFTLCDAAHDYGGKLCILGAFDHIRAKIVPLTHPHFAVAIRIRFHRIEEGGHKLRLTFADEDGKAVLAPVEAGVNVRFAEDARSATMNLVLGVNALKLERFGEYSVDLAVDGVHLGSHPVYVERAPEPPAAGSV
jgi:hypothetical protein